MTDDELITLKECGQAGRGGEAMSGDSWWADWSLRSMAIGPVCALLGWIAVSILPLWFHRR